MFQVAERTDVTNGMHTVLVIFFQSGMQTLKCFISCE